MGVGGISLQKSFKQHLWNLGTV